MTITTDALVKYNELNENSNTRVKGALFGDASGKIKTWAILTPENPLGKLLTPQENNKRLKSFKSALKKLNLTYTPIEGSYGGDKEHSFIVFNLRLKDATYLASTYQQESFFYGKTKSPVGDRRDTAAEITYYETSDGGDTYSEIETSRDIETLNDAEDFFSRHGDFQFKINMKIFGEGFPDIVDEDSFLESFNESLTSRSASVKRWHAYNG